MSRLSTPRSEGSGSGSQQLRVGECADPLNSRAGSCFRQTSRWRPGSRESGRVLSLSSQHASPPASLSARATLHIRVSDFESPPSSQSRYILAHFIPLAWQMTVLCGFRKLLLIKENFEHCLGGPAVIPRDNMQLSRTRSISLQVYTTSSAILCSFEQGHTGLA